LTLAAAALVVIGFAFLGVTYGGRLNLTRNVGYAVLAFVLAVALYALARRVGRLDPLQRSRLGWGIALIVLIPFLVGPLLSRFSGPRKTP
jgi:hypothetical protein